MFANCSVDLSDFRIRRASCLSDQHHTVLLTADDGFPSYFSEFRCHTWTVLVPVARQYPTGITETVFVKWNRPDCRSCERSGGSCRLRGSTGSHVECFGLSKRAKLGILSGITLSSLLCTFGIACYHRWRAQVSRHFGRLGQLPNNNDDENNVANILFPSSPSRETRRASSRVMGLDSLTIESYPKSQVDDDGQVPKPIDNVCAICLSVYQPKETLRIIPMYGHYFHA
ncbi:hypothetical protein NL676_010030 [Syzygium grande]|nr:hypothetical protein NL676_010030 [Syzygium grande]